MLELLGEGGWELTDIAVPVQRARALPTFTLCPSGRSDAAMSGYGDLNSPTITRGLAMADELIAFLHASGKGISTLPEGFQETIKLRPDGAALRTVGGAFRSPGSSTASACARSPSGLAGLGVKRGDTVGIMLTNRPEFHLVDTAVLHLGCHTVLDLQHQLARAD